MFNVSFQDISEQDLDRLIQDEVPESIRLEYKRQINLDSKADKAEAAKDVSAMANTVGGRILYGVDEKRVGGTEVASKICPLHHGSVEARLQNILNSSIHPRPRLRTRQVPIAAGGFVLLLEVYPGSGGDLYMVEGFTEYRFYKRGEKGRVLMTEPEIREAYARIAVSRQALESAVENNIKSEEEHVRGMQQSVFVVPWYGHPRLVDPRQFGRNLGYDLATGPLENNKWRNSFLDLRIMSEGYRGLVPRSAEFGQPETTYVLIHRSGLVHLAETLPLEPHRTSDAPFYPEWALDTMIAALLTAEYVLNKAAYWGFVRVLHRLRAPRSLVLRSSLRWDINGSKSSPFGPDEYDHIVPEIDLPEITERMQPILRELLDQLFQTGGRRNCPWFDEAGNLRSDLNLDIDPTLQVYLQKQRA